jgi:hypothetical protein
MNPLIQCKTTILPLFIAAFLVWFGPLPKAEAIMPPPDGGYPGGNTAEGKNALLGLTTGGFNTAVGFFSLRSNTTESFNTAIGAGTLFANTADENTATGAGALLSNTIGFSNTANGAFALLSNTSGRNNTAAGANALQNNTTGDKNAANGVSALQNNTTGTENTALGNQTLQFNTTGNNNIAVGSGAGGNLTTGANNIDIGNAGVTAESDTIRIGISQSATFIAGINGTAVTGTAVVVNGSGQLGVAPSSKRFKDEIKPMDKASEAILALKPVTFHYRKEIDPAGWSQFGLVAEEVEKVNPDLVVCDKEGRPYTIRYDQVNAMLLNEFLKEHRTVQELKKEVAALSAIVKQQAQQLEKVSADVEMGTVGQKVARNNQ